MQLPASNTSSQARRLWMIPAACAVISFLGGLASNLLATSLDPILKPYIRWIWVVFGAALVTAIVTAIQDARRGVAAGEKTSTGHGLNNKSKIGNGEIMPDLEELQAALARLVSGTETQLDRRNLQELLLKGQMALMTGERAATINGAATDAVIITGDKNVVMSFNGADAETIQRAFSLLERRNAPHIPPNRDIISPALAMARRSLAHLEEQAAGFGRLHVPTHLQIELEEKRREVAELEARLKDPEEKNG